MTPTDALALVALAGITGAGLHTAARLSCPLAVRALVRARQWHSLRRLARAARRPVAEPVDGHRWTVWRVHHETGRIYTDKMLLLEILTLGGAEVVRLWSTERRETVAAVPRDQWAAWVGEQRRDPRSVMLPPGVTP